MHYQLERTYGCRISDAWTYRGLKTAILENELLRIVVLIDKGADIYQFVHKPTDVDFLWRSPWGVRDPSKFLPTTGSPVGIWMDTYEGGWQTVLPAGGYAGNYKGADLGLHAEVNNMPWDCVITEDTPERVSMRCWVRTARLPFFFEKTLTLTSGSAALDIQETLVNEGEEPAHCVWGQHIALGAPFLSEDCVIDLPGGKLITLEIEPTYAELAREFARRAGLAGVIEVRLGVAMESLRQLVEERVAPFDACFIDADKAGYPAYLQWALRLVRPGGIILGDNVLWGGLVLEEPPRDDDTLALQVFNRRLATDPNLVSTIIPIRDGLAVAVIRPRAEEAEEGEAGGEEPAAAQEPTAA